MMLLPSCTMRFPVLLRIPHVGALHKPWMALRHLAQSVFVKFAHENVFTQVPLEFPMTYLSAFRTV